MNTTTYLQAAGIFVVVLVLALVVVRWATRRSGGHVSRDMGRSLTQLALLLAIVATGAFLLVAATPEARGQVLVGVLGSLPHLLLAIAIVVVSVFIGRMAGAITESALRGWSAAMSTRLGRIVRVGIIVLGTIIALEQIGVSTELIVLVITSAVAALALAAALSLGLGTAPIAKQVATGRHIGERYDIGTQVESDLFAGTIAEIGMTSVRLVDADGSSTDVPNVLFLETPVRVIRP